MKKVTILSLIILLFAEPLGAMDVEQDPAQQLIQAAGQGHINELERLVKNGVDINSKVEGDTALIEAIARQNTQACRWLIEHGANVNLADGRGRTPLMFSIDDLELARLLLNQPTIEIDKSDKEGETALIIASRHNNLNVFRLLIERGANVNHADDNGTTPLMAAAFRGKQDFCEELIRRGADVSFKNKEMNTALFLAAAASSFAPSDSNYLNICKLLINSMIRLNKDQKVEITTILKAFKKNQTLKSKINRDAQQLVVRIQADRFRRQNAQLVTEELNKIISERAQPLKQTLKAFLNEELERRKGF